MFNKILSITLLLTVLFSFASCKRNPEQLLIIPSIGFYDENNQDYKDFMDILTVAIQTGSIKEAIVVGTYSSTNSQISDAQSILPPLQKYFDFKEITTNIDDCSVAQFQALENLVKTTEIKDFTDIFIATEQSRRPKSIIEAFIAFYADEEQKTWIKNKSEEALAENIDNRSKIMDEILDQINIWTEDKSPKIKIHRTNFSSFTEEYRKQEMYDLTFKEILAMLDETKRKEFVDQALAKISATGNVEEAKNFLLEKGCDVKLYE